MPPDTATPPVADALQILQAAGIKASAVPRFGEPTIHLEHEGMSLVASFLGAQILEWTPPECNQRLWPGDEKLHVPGTPIRGGIPLCWPWFGAAHLPFDGPGHGFARRRHWTLVTASVQDSEITLYWQFEISGDNYHLAADYHVTAGRNLDLRLVTTNLGTEPCLVTPAFHPYFAVPNLAGTQIRIASPVRVQDRLTGRPCEITDRVTFEGRELELEWSPWRDLRLESGDDSRMDIRSDDATHCVVWNPGPEKTASIDDLDADAFNRFVCIEPGRLGPDTSRISPGETQALQMVLSVTPAP